MTSDSRDDAIREAKRYVRDVVRNDWSFEFSAKPGAPPPTYPANPEPTEVLEWRLREYDSSGSELEPQYSPIASPLGLHEAGDVSPGAVLSVSSADTRRTERRRKRRRQMEEEMSWNEGLRTWAERRDAWSGARSREKVREWEARRPASVEVVGGGGELENAVAAAAGDATDTDAQSIPASATLRPIAVPATGESSNLAERTEAALNITEKHDKTLAQQLQAPSPENSNLAQNETSAQASLVDTDPIDLPQRPSTSSAIPATSPPPSTSTPSSTSTQTASPDPFHDPFIPVVPSLISTSNPIRASITPSMYPSIYSKVVLQGLTPTVPINLADMTKAMVQGWKADGQWPPKPQNLVLPSANDAVVRPSHASATKHPDTPAIPPNSSAADKDRNPPSSPESKRKSGIASTVRKVLHFSGFHPHPFHRRNSSSQHHSHPEDLSPAGEGSNHASSVAGEQPDK
ncbi:hypothetical protein BJX64DRAFT_135186 [Aspergillus heterothallicus]